ncbi:LacI family DNA-binding transcriptional regulator [Aliiroseovarius lamellibrachiae]|uniref:LacI family DNA-binding transcriptional regulator n=1 Tax=Aliiroseovarius lamellibrachiae TaxID=1924933 RepID=UPI001BE0804C|nr:LacI family DNA-binding transcriptional regulator [Aliiroseovarius lamellibrachiae]MBT2131538.1 LacI family transcriptional regulator [Aliiroseovarius lamellibrachiae]
MSDQKIKNMEGFAAVSGISRPTLSKYFNDPDSVRKSTRQKIEAALKKHDYRPNVYAVNQNRRQTKNIGLVVPNLTDPFFAGIARTIEGLIVKAGFNPLLLSSHGGPEQEISNLESLRSIKPAGVLLAPLGRASFEDQVAAFASEVPTVLFDANLEGIGEAFFGSDNNQSINLIVEYLCRSGEPPVFFEMKTPINPNAYKRRTAYIAAMGRLGHEPHLIQVDGQGWDFEEIGFREGARILTQQKLPTNTILCSNDRLAIGLLSAAFENGIKVGLDATASLRIAGHDDHPFSRFTCPSLTTVSQDYDAIAARGVETILKLIESEKRMQRREETLFEGKLVMRGSA